jgi:ribosomal protein S18 acetylase RimI-like enzyme
MSNADCEGVVSINSIQEDEYRSIPWEDKNGKILVIHRLAVHPKYQRKGYASKLMDFAEMPGFDNNYSSIRLDAYSEILPF